MQKNNEAINYRSSSNTHSKIQKCLEETYGEVESEKMIDDYYMVDLYVPSKNLAIEVQGTFHFNGLGKKNKKSLTKQKVLH